MKQVGKNGVGLMRIYIIGFVSFIGQIDAEYSFGCLSQDVSGGLLQVKQIREVENYD